MLDKVKVQEELREIRDRLYDIQYQYEYESNFNEQSIRVRQRISQLLDIYSQIISGREFNEDYLDKYL